MDYKRIFSNEAHLDRDTGLIVQLSKANRLLLGTFKEFPLIEKMTLLNSRMVIEVEGKYYLKLNSYSDYLNLIKKQFGNNLKNTFPYNYYRTFNEDEIDNIYTLAFETIDKYINYLKNQDDHLSKTISDIIYTKKLLQANLISELDGLYCLNFEKAGRSLPINLFSEKIDAPYSLCYSEDDGDAKYKKLFEDHKQFLLMEDPETFLITNLQRVTGDEIFSTMIVKSYLNKNDFTTPIIGLCNLILWKNKHQEDIYVIKFCEIYSHLIENKNTNFEGINKFLLNLEVSNLQDYNVKEQINELYYQITHELIRSFELLYKGK